MAAIPCSREHLTKEWLQTVLDSANEETTVDKIDTEAGSKKGDNFSAELVKVLYEGTKNGQSCTGSLVVKMASADGSVGNKTLDVPIFPTEVEAYGKVFVDMMKEQQQEEKIPLPVARCYLATQQSMSGLIVMEDLKASGFKLANFFEGQTLDECKLVMTKMAALHAAGYNLKFRKGEETMEKMYPQLFSNSFWINKDKMEGMFTAGIKASADIIAGFPEYKQKAPLIKEKAEEISQGCLSSLQMQAQHPLSTVCQGDCWSNNMLFKYDEAGKAIDVKLLDFELLSFYLPVTDLIYYLNSSTLPQFRKAHLRDLLKIYHNELFSNLSKLGVTEISPEELSVEWLWNEFHGRRVILSIGFSLTIIPMILSLCENLYNFTNKDALGGFEDAFKKASKTDPRKHPFLIDRITGVMEQIESCDIF